VALVALLVIAGLTTGARPQTPRHWAFVWLLIVFLAWALLGSAGCERDEWGTWTGSEPTLSSRVRQSYTASVAQRWKAVAYGRRAYDCRFTLVGRSGIAHRRDWRMEAGQADPNGAQGI